MTSRKKFLQLSSLALTSALLPKWGLGNPAPASILETASIKDQFPINKNIIFLNNATMGPSPQPVIDALMEGLQDVSERGLYGRRKVETIDSIATFIGAARDEVCMTQNVSHGINIMVWGVSLKAGDEIIISTQEHAGNATPWMYRAKQENLVVKSVPPGKNADETLQILKKAITKKTRVIALPHLPCTTGQVFPIKEICTYAKSKNIITCIDGAHGTGMLQLNVKELGCDYYASCCHKWLCSAQGIGYLYITKEKLAALKPKFYGADGLLEFNSIAKIPFIKEKTDSASRFMFGTQSGALMNSATAAIQFQNGIGRKAIEQHVKDLSLYVYEALNEMPKAISIFTPLEEKSRAGIIAFQFKQKDNKAFYELLLAKGIVIRFVAENKLDFLRVSTHIYNSKEQIDELMKAVKAYI
jgi:cysteine desulfurase/selenocysteine lyase